MTHPYYENNADAVARTKREYDQFRGMTSQELQARSIRQAHEMQNARFSDWADDDPIDTAEGKPALAGFMFAAVAFAFILAAAIAAVWK